MFNYHRNKVLGRTPNTRKPAVRNFSVEIFNKGLQNDIEPEAIEKGAASDSLNWLTKGDKIELRRGSKVIGETGAGGAITGLFNSAKTNDIEVAFRSRGKKLEYCLDDNEEWIEIGTDVLGADADGEEISFDEYISPHGNQVWASSPNSSLFKIMTANPGSITDMYNEALNFKGRLSIFLNRMFLINRIEDKNGVYGSWIDELNSTTVTAESIGSAGSLNYTGTLAFKAGGSKRTCFAIEITDGSETFKDNWDGTLTGDAGGTGTINYTTGEYDITFNEAATGPVTADYQWEDSTNNGIADFGKSLPRVAGEGFIFRQDKGGPIQNIVSYNDLQYCLHTRKSYRLNIGFDDTEATNRIWRENVGISNWRASVATGEGIYYIDDSNENKPAFRLLTLDAGSTEVIPRNKSDKLNLSNYRFDKAVADTFEEFVLIACRTKDSAFNNRVFLYNTIWKTWDVLDYLVSCFTKHNGALWAGDPIQNTVWELFSGWDDDNSEYENYWIGKLEDFGVENLKKVKRLVLRGLIQKNQEIDVYFSYDNEDFVKVGTVKGIDSYVDLSNPVTVGTNTLGKKVVGGGNNDTEAFNYETELRVRTDKFERIKIKFVATKIGYASVSLYNYKDIRLKSERIPSKYRTS